ncbi:MAG: hypothetical protein U9Q12_01115 [Patescibacteria group bacterium]|nr:hypothetical protein [Patescibacteria group bacterium]
MKKLLIPMMAMAMTFLLTSEGRTGGHTEAPDIVSGHKTQYKEKKQINKPAEPEIIYTNEYGNGVRDHLDHYRTLDMDLEYRLPSKAHGWVNDEVLEAEGGLEQQIDFRAKITKKDSKDWNAEMSACVDLYYSTDEFFSREYDNMIDRKCVKLAQSKERKIQFDNFEFELEPGKHFFFIDVLHGSRADISNNKNINEFVEVVVAEHEVTAVIEPEMVIEPQLAVDAEPMVVAITQPEPAVVVEPEPEEATGITIADTCYTGQTTGHQWIPVNMPPAEVWKVLAEYDVKTYLLKYVEIPAGTGFHNFRTRFTNGEEKIYTFIVR